MWEIELSLSKSRMSTLSTDFMFNFSRRRIKRFKDCLCNIDEKGVRITILLNVLVLTCWETAGCLMVRLLKKTHLYSTPLWKSFVIVSSGITLIPTALRLLVRSGPGSGCNLKVPDLLTFKKINISSIFYLNHENINIFSRI